MKKHLLRLCLLIIIYQASITNAKAQWVSIPDSNFGTWLNNWGYSQCVQGDNARRADEVVVQTSAFSNGVYFVTVENEKGRVTKKLVIQR